MNGKKRYNGELYEFTLRQGFLPKHTNEIFYNWRNEGKMNVFKADGTEVKNKKHTYLGYRYYKEESQKATFNLK